jgi:hypothetical protein
MTDPRSRVDSPQNRLAAAVRRINSLAVGRPLDADAVDAAAGQLDRIATSLESAAAPGKKPRGQPDHTGHPQDLFPTSPMIGYWNPISPPIDVWSVEGENGLPELRGRATFGYPYEGPPTCVHGGVIAELFDELLGSANIITGRAGMTGTLTVRYLRPTPLLAELDLVARQDRVEGRKIFAWGGIYHDGELTAEAEGIFVEMRPERMIKIVTGHAGGSREDVIDPELRAFVERGGEILGVDGPPPT